eukprot:symbB.v1.2.021357.t1/scaffold1841.1/size101071/1
MLHFEIFTTSAVKNELSFECFLIDRSSNGTFVNGKVVGKGKSCPLHTGDEIEVLPKNRVGEDEMIAFLFRNSTNLSQKGDVLLDTLKKPLVLCGPVVGAVTDNSANLLLELDCDVEVTCVATALSYGDQEVEVRTRFFRHDPGVIMLRGLRPLTTYRISWRPPLQFSGDASLMDHGATQRGLCVVRTLPKAGN